MDHDKAQVLVHTYDNKTACLTQYSYGGGFTLDSHKLDAAPSRAGNLSGAV
jgi:hypothetical protein